MRTRTKRSKDAAHRLGFFASSQDGVAAVEFALIAPVLFIMLLGILDYAMAIFNKMELEAAVRAGAQYALVKDSSSADITTVVTNSTNLTVANINVTTAEFCECSDGSPVACDGICAVSYVRSYTTVTANYIHTWIFLPGTQTLTKSVTLRTK